MRKYIDDINNADAVIMLLEVLEVKTNNKIIKELQEEAAVKLKAILANATNPDWLLVVLLKAREEVRKSL